MSVLISVLAVLRGSIRSRAALHIEVLALRHQLQVLQRSRPRRLRLARADRWLWVWLSRAWGNWRRAVVIVKPETVVAWHRQGFRLFWTWKSRRRDGRPPVAADARALIRTMSEHNPLWGAPAFCELAKPGSTPVRRRRLHGRRRLRPRRRHVSDQSRPPKSWRRISSWCRHTGRLLFVLVILAHDLRRVVHTAVTERPTAAWTAQQFREAFPWDQAPRYLIRDRDRAFQAVKATAEAMGLEEVLTAPRSERENACG